MNALLTDLIFHQYVKHKALLAPTFFGLFRYTYLWGALATGHSTKGCREWTESFIVVSDFLQYL